MENNNMISVLVFVPEGYENLDKIRKNISEQTFSNLELIIIEESGYGNMNRYKAFNSFFEKAEGKAVLFMDVHTEMDKNCLRKLWNYMERFPDVLAVGSDYIKKTSDEYVALPHSHCSIEAALLNGDVFGNSAILVRSETFKRLNGFNETYTLYAQYDFICRLSLLGHIVNIAEPLFHSEVNETSEIEKAKEEHTTIRRNYQKDFINNHLLPFQNPISENDMNAMDIGLVISYYTYAAFYNEEEYGEKAECLLERILTSLYCDIPVCIKDGLLGVACGIVYMIRNNFIEGNEDEILSEIDNLVYKELICMNDEKDVDWDGWLYYSRKRLSFSTLGKRGLSGILFRQQFIYMLDCLWKYLQKNTISSTSTQSDLEWIHLQKICPATTEKILNKIKNIKVNEKRVFPSMEEADVAFVIPLRIDSIERERNLNTLIKELSSFNYEIWILEADKKRHYQLKKETSNIHYIFIEDFDPIFHRTKYLNQLLLSTECDIVGIWDTDVIFRKEQIEDSIRQIKSGKAVMSFPYDGNFIMLSPQDSELYTRIHSMDYLMEKYVLHHPKHGFISVGGAFFVNRKIYIEAGGENERFYGWGPEDAERVKRMEILKLPVYRSKGPLFHLFHPRKENSWYANKKIELKNRMEFLNVCSKSYDELYDYIKQW